MKLFRRFLLSLFPNDFAANGMNPVNMFVSFISPKQFFSVIHRRIVENYKLNHFDIALDPFEVKVGFGEQPSLQVKDIDVYYSYGSVANLNGWISYLPGNLAVPISCVVAVKTKHILEEFDDRYATTFLMSVYLLSFLFVSRLRIFPYESEKDNYHWFIDVCFNFFRSIARRHHKEFDKDEFESLKSALLQELQVFFFLFHAMKRINNVFVSPGLSDKEYYEWLFHDELRKGKQKTLVNEFIVNREKIASKTTFVNKDRELLKLVFPADMQIKHIFSKSDWYVVTDKLLDKIYPTEQLNEFLLSFLKSDERLDEFFVFLTDYKHFKEVYFSGIKQVTSQKFRMQNDYETSKEIDEFMSSIEEAGSVEGIKVPEKLKQEGALMDKLVNFYISYLGGLSVGRGDNFFLRMTRKDFVTTILKTLRSSTLKQDALYYYGGLLYNYSKNVFYYTYAFENVRAGVESFSLPTKSSFKEVYSNMFILKLFEENFVITLLQDLNRKPIKIYITNAEILDVFKNILREHISGALEDEKDGLVEYVYGPALSLLEKGEEVKTYMKAYLEEDLLSSLKDNLYTLDLWLWIAAVRFLQETTISLTDTYGDTSIVGILSTLRETFLGFMLYYTSLRQEARDGDSELHPHALKRIYILEVLNISDQYYRYIDAMIEHVMVTHHSLLEQWNRLDDNSSYFELGIENWKKFIENKSVDKIASDVNGEDIVRFRGFLKTITYYNKRYVIPK